MRVLRVIGSMDPSSGGPCQGIRNSIPALEEQGVRNEVVCFDDPAASFVGKDSFPVHALGAGKGPWNYSARLIPWLLANFSRFDAVIVHGLWLYHSYAVTKALTRYKTQAATSHHAIPKVFVMPHGMLDPYFQKAPGRKLKALRNWFYWKLIESNVINKADGVLFTCEAELQLAREPFKPYSPKREINVGYGIAAPPAFDQAKQNMFLEQYPELQGQPYLLFLSRIHEKKGVDLLIRAYAEVAGQPSKENTKQLSVSGTAQDNEPDYARSVFPKLVIAGPGMDSAYGEHLQQLISKTEGLQNRILFPGMLHGDLKWGAFYGCEAFVLPSHQENFGIAVVEALASGKPVLISNQVNIWREIEKAGGGLVADDTLGGVQELLERWVKLTGDEKQEMGQKAMQAFKKYFAIGPAAENLRKALAE